MPIEGDRVRVEVDGREEQGRVVWLDARRLDVAYEWAEGVLVQSSQWPLLGFRFPPWAEGGAPTPEGVARAEQLLGELARQAARVVSHRAALAALARQAAEAMRADGAWAEAISPEDLAAARRHLRHARRREGLDQRTSRSEERALAARASVASQAWSDLLGRVGGLCQERLGWALSGPALEHVVAQAAPWAVPARG